MTSDQAMKTKLAAILSIAMLLSACGQSGGLYLVQNPQTQETNQQMNQTLQQQGAQDGAD